MRQAYAKWLIDLSEMGMGLGSGELARIEQAEFRVRGLAVSQRSEVPSVESNVSIGARLLPWEADVLSVVTHELLPLFANPQDGGADGK
jgi:hypothetical protein